MVSTLKNDEVHEEVPLHVQHLQLLTILYIIPPTYKVIVNTLFWLRLLTYLCPCVNISSHYEAEMM